MINLEVMAGQYKNAGYSKESHLQRFRSFWKR